MSSDYITGTPLIRYLKYHPAVGKKQLYTWIKELCANLERFHRCNGNPSYQYLNPYSIIVNEEGRLFLLDLGNKEQKDLLYLMQRRYVRERFLSPDNQYYQRTSVKEDIYSFGKTIQYLLSVADIEPPLGRIEEKRFQKMISRCIDQNSRKTYRTIRELSDDFIKKNTDGRQGRGCGKRIRIKTVALIAALAGTLSIWKIYAQKKEGEILQSGQEMLQIDAELTAVLEEYQRKEDSWDEEKTKMEKAFLDRETELLQEIAFFCFIELQDYRRCVEILNEIQHEDGITEDFRLLCEWFEEGRIDREERDPEVFLRQWEEKISEYEDPRYYYCLLKGYQAIGSEEAKSEAVRLGELCLASEEWMESVSIEIEEEIKELCAVDMAAGDSMESEAE